MSDTKDLATILSTSFFRIPNYQRGYSWENRQLSELWDDLTDMSVGKPHYTGALYVEELPKSEKPTSESWAEDQGAFYSVVDGQQRMTTLTLLLSVLLQSSNVKEHGLNGETQDDLLKKYLFTTHCQTGEKAFRFSCGSPESELRKFFESLCSTPSITERETEEWKTKASSRYERNLVDAKRFFSEKMEGLSLEEKSNLLKKVSKGLLFDFRIVGIEFDPQVVFETMNNRGKPLTILEKLKNRLMFLSSAIDNLDASSKVRLREMINSAWGRIYEELAKDADLPLDEDDFLRAHLSLYRRPKENTYSKAVAESRLFKMFSRHPDRYSISEEGDEQSAPESTLSYEKIADYVKDLREFAPVWREIHSDYGMYGRCRLLSGLMETRILLAAIRKSISPDCAPDILQKLECLLFRSTIKKIDEGLLSTLARNIYRKFSVFVAVRDDQCSPAESVNGILDQELRETAASLGPEELVKEFRRLFDYKRGNCGYFRWSGIKYFLFLQEEHLANRGATLRIPWKDFSKASIEHVIPQSAVGKSESWWKREINEAIPSGINESEEESLRKILVNSLGNLVLLGTAENASVSDDPWLPYSEAGKEGKQQRYLGGTMSLGAVSISRDMCNAESPSWNAFKIKERGKDLLKTLLEALDLSCIVSEQQKLALLGFDRLNETKDTKFQKLSAEEIERIVGSKKRGNRKPSSTKRSEREDSRTRPVKNETWSAFKDYCLSKGRFTNTRFGEYKWGQLVVPATGVGYKLQIVSVADDIRFEIYVDPGLCSERRRNPEEIVQLVKSRKEKILSTIKPIGWRDPLNHKTKVFRISLIRPVDWNKLDRFDHVIECFDKLVDILRKAGETIVEE